MSEKNEQEKNRMLELAGITPDDDTTEFVLSEAVGPVAQAVIISVASLPLLAFFGQAAYFDHVDTKEKFGVPHKDKIKQSIGNLFSRGPKDADVKATYNIAKKDPKIMSAMKKLMSGKTSSSKGNRSELMKALDLKGSGVKNVEMFLSKMLKLYLKDNPDQDDTPYRGDLFP